MALTSEEYEKLLTLYIKLRLAEDMLAEELEELREGNMTLREMILRKEE